jgi:DHA2 family multidrug resistance protein
MEAKQPIGSSVFYGSVLSSSVFIGIVAANVETSTNFKEIYSYLVLYLVFVLILVLVGFNNKSGIRRYPLYQIDWIGACFFAVSAAAFAYTMIYGSKYYWFTDHRIKTSALIAAFGAVFYIYRELTVKRPGIDLSVFKYRKFWAGLLLLALYYGMKESINLIFAYTANVVQWSPVQIMLLGLANVAGLITFIIITAQILARHKGTIFRFFTAGFCMMLLYHLWMYFIFTPDLSYGDLMFPMFFQ